MTEHDSAPSTDTEIRRALNSARVLVAAGVPLFLAHPNPDSKLGYTLPDRWHLTEPDPGVVDAWRPGLALGAVMGRGVDLVDVDPRNGGDPRSLEGLIPRAYATAATPSGGVHTFVAALGVASRDNVLPGIDVKAGAPDGIGRGFAFIAPTTNASKVDGVVHPYQWVVQPDPATLALRGDDATGAPLAAKIRELRATSGVRRLSGPDWWVAFLSSTEPQSAAAANRAIEDKLHEITEWAPASGEGFRRVLLRAAMTLGGYVGGGWLDEQDARERLEEAVSTVWDSPDTDDLLWIQQGLDDGAAQPFHVYTPADEALYGETAQAAAGQGEDPPFDAPNGHTAAPAGAPGAPPPGPPTWTIWDGLGRDAFDPQVDGTDQEYAKAVAFRTFGVLRYATDARVWVKRGAEQWNESKDDLARWAIAKLAELMPLGELPVPKDPSERTPAHWQAHRRGIFTSTAGTGRIAAKVKDIVLADHPSAIELATLDSNPEVFWAGGLPWNLRESRERPAIAMWVDPATPHLHTAWCAPDPRVPTPRWDAFLDAVLPDPELRAWTIRVLSIALTGYADAALPVLYGRERSGKSSLVEMLVSVLGSYAHAASPKLLAATDGGSGSSIVADLRGRRLSFIDEGPKRGHDATERLKQLTGGAVLNAAKKYQDETSFRPTHTLVMTTNNEPALTDPALKARMRVIPCDEPEGKVRPARVALLGHALRVEAPGILAAMMSEAAAYLDDRDTASNAAAPLSVRALGDELAAAQDPVREWLDLCTVPADPGTPARDLFRSFVAWHQDTALYRRLSPPSETSFGRTLTEAGYPPAKRHGVKYRPLSVLGGPGGGGFGSPFPTQTAAPTVTGVTLLHSPEVQGQTGEGLAPGPGMGHTGSDMEDPRGTVGDGWGTVGGQSAEPSPTPVMPGQGPMAPPLGDSGDSSPLTKTSDDDYRYIYRTENPGEKGENNCPDAQPSPGGFGSGSDQQKQAGGRFGQPSPTPDIPDTLDNVPNVRFSGATGTSPNVTGRPAPAPAPTPAPAPAAKPRPRPVLPGVAGPLDDPAIVAAARAIDAATATPEEGPQ